MSARGEIVLVDFPYSDGSGSKIRPALILQNDADNRRLQNTVVAMITGNVAHAHEATQFLIDPATPAGTGSGLHGPSVVKCNVLTTVAWRTVIRTIGSLPPGTMRQVDQCLKSALQLS